MNPKNPYRQGSIRYRIAQHYLDGKSIGRTYHLLKPEVEAGQIVFKSNTGTGSREALPMPEQRKRLYQTVERTYDELHGKVPLTEKAEEKVEEKVKPEKPTSAKDRFLAEIRRLRKFCKDRAMGGNPLDTIGMRPVVYGRRMIDAGVPVDVILSAIGMHWPEDARHEANLPTAETEMANFARTLPAVEGTHYLFPYVELLAKIGVPVCLIGPAGSGKTDLAETLAEHTGKPFGSLSVTAGMTPGWMLGTWTINPEQPFVEKEFTKIYREGGVYLFDELDGGEPNILLQVNKALASRRGFTNPINGEFLPRSDGFTPIAAMNTFGLGANRDFTGRERLDFATVDRWRMGRVYVPFDESLEESILYN